MLTLMLAACFRNAHRMPARAVCEYGSYGSKCSAASVVLPFVHMGFSAVCLGCQECLKLLICLAAPDGYLNLSFFYQCLFKWWGVVQLNAG